VPVAPASGSAPGAPLWPHVTQPEALTAASPVPAPDASPLAPGPVKQVPGVSPCRSRSKGQPAPPATAFLPLAAVSAMEGEEQPRGAA
jgi:hypothetical protein